MSTLADGTAGFDVHHVADGRSTFTERSFDGEYDPNDADQHAWYQRPHRRARDDQAQVHLRLVYATFEAESEVGRAQQIKTEFER